MEISSRMERYHWGALDPCGNGRVFATQQARGSGKDSGIIIWHDGPQREGTIGLLHIIIYLFIYIYIYLFIYLFIYNYIYLFMIMYD